MRDSEPHRRLASFPGLPTTLHRACSFAHCSQCNLHEENPFIVSHSHVHCNYASDQLTHLRNAGSIGNRAPVCSNLKGLHRPMRTAFGASASVYWPGADAHDRRVQSPNIHCDTCKTWTCERHGKNTSGRHATWCMRYAPHNPEQGKRRMGTAAANPALPASARQASRAWPAMNYAGYCRASCESGARQW
ncbi:hypothetical protein GSI_00060 [Ganoderma sinense ZZ0214-1]|uniref:Uncharacterized protein n=1 Tax=Ganoderma sinense ZZ0214-1 TaxID=1077348 RepID=A0A2G8SRK0_9APHY|nr:hypothetical protein GSI_00060 [Ganoderma sinense ZZ0214-1]